MFQKEEVLSVLDFAKEQAFGMGERRAQLLFILAVRAISQDNPVLFTGGDIKKLIFSLNEGDISDLPLVLQEQFHLGFMDATVNFPSFLSQEVGEDTVGLDLFVRLEKILASLQPYTWKRAKTKVTVH